MRKIAVFGGTFNPIHNGHIHLAKCFAELLHVEKVLVIPTNIPPHKQAPNLASAQARLAMCRLAVCNDPLFEVSSIEVCRSGPSYTAETLCELKQIYPDSELFLLTGEDMFVTLEQWYHPETIYSLSTICAAPRSKAGSTALCAYAEKLRSKGVKTRVENINYLPISSTMVREAVKAGKSISALVPKAVEQYIYAKKLYLE